MQKILHPKDMHSLEVSKFMYNYSNSQLPATFNNYVKLITDVHPYNTRQTKTRQLLYQKHVQTQALITTYSAIFIFILFVCEQTRSP